MRETKQADAFVLQYPQRTLNFIEEKFDPAAIHFLGRMENSGFHSHSLCQTAKSSKVFRQSGATKAEPRLQKAGSDPRVKSNCPGNLLDICAKPLAQIPKHIGVGKLHSKESIGGVLN